MRAGTPDCTDIFPIAREIGAWLWILLPQFCRCSVDAIKQYKMMSSEMWAPEGYIRDLCALYIHQKLKVPVSIEVSHTYFASLWRLNDDEHTELRRGLGGFKVDMATNLSKMENNNLVTSLVEFKLYTGLQAESDIGRLRLIIEMAKRKGENIDGYVVICEQAFPHQAQTFVRDAFASFGQKFKLKKQLIFDIEETSTIDRDGAQRLGRWPVGVCVIDVNDT